MCGLLGWTLKRRFKDWDFLAQYLLVMMDKRGGDSWGYADISNPKRTLMTKGKGYITQSISGKNLQPFTDILGHTRRATHGAVVDDNSHPFRFGTVTGAHNGIIINHTELNKRHERNLAVDSMHIFKHIADNKSLSDLHGYGAITFVDSRYPTSIFVGRFNGGELSVAVLTINDKPVGLVWASTQTSLDGALELANLRGIVARFVNLENDTLYQLDTTTYTVTKISRDNNWDFHRIGRSFTSSYDIGDDDHSYSWVNTSKNRPGAKSAATAGNNSYARQDTTRTTPTLPTRTTSPSGGRTTYDNTRIRNGIKAQLLSLNWEKCTECQALQPYMFKFKDTTRSCMYCPSTKPNVSFYFHSIEAILSEFHLLPTLHQRTALLNRLQNLVSFTSTTSYEIRGHLIDILFPPNLLEDLTCPQSSLPSPQSNEPSPTSKTPSNTSSDNSPHIEQPANSTPASPSTDPSSAASAPHAGS